MPTPSPLGFLGKALGKKGAAAAKEVAKLVKSAAKPAVKAPARTAPKVTAKPTPKVTAPTPIVRTTTPARSPFVSAATPERTPLIIPGATRPAAGVYVPPSVSRNVRSVAQQESMQAERAAVESATRAQAAQASKASTFGQPKRMITPEAPAIVQAPTPSFTQAAGIAPATTAPALAGAGTDVVQEAAKRTAPRFLRPALEGAGTLAPFYGQTESGQELPSWARTALNVGGLLAGGSLAARGLRGKTGILNTEVRDAFNKAPGFFAKTKFVAPKLIAPAVGAYTLKTIANPFDTSAPVTPPATALPADTETETVLPPLGGEIDGTLGGPSAEDDTLAAIDAALGNIASGTGTADDAATAAAGQTAILEKGVSDAMAALEAAYGGPAAADAAIAAGDPILLQQLAGIEADYQAGLGQIQANYSGALAQVQGYQTQADQLLQDTAAAQMAGFGAAAGGLEALSPGTGLTGDQAAAAGISDTALGGAGITGAALSRGLAGAASVQAAADRLRLGTDLSGQLATGRLTQADLEAGLARAAVGEKAVARTESAKRESAARELAKQQKREDAVRIAELKYQAALDKQAEATRKSENTAAQKQRIAELKMNAELDLAMKIASMTPAERAAYKGSSAGGKTFKAPSWYGKRDSRDPNTPIDVKGATGKVTVASAQRAQDLLDSQLQQPEAQDPTTALAVWSDFYNKVGADAIAIYGATDRPQSASQLVKQLFSTPKK